MRGGVCKVQGPRRARNIGPEVQHSDLVLRVLAAKVGGELVPGGVR